MEISVEEIYVFIHLMISINFVVECFDDVDELPDMDEMWSG